MFYSLSVSIQSKKNVSLLLASRRCGRGILGRGLSLRFLQQRPACELVRQDNIPFVGVKEDVLGHLRFLRRQLVAGEVALLHDKVYEVPHGHAVHDRRLVHAAVNPLDLNCRHNVLCAVLKGNLFTVEFVPHVHARAVEVGGELLERAAEAEHEGAHGDADGLHEFEVHAAVVHLRCDDNERSRVVGTEVRRDVLSVLELAAPDIVPNVRHVPRLEVPLWLRVRRDLRLRQRRHVELPLLHDHVLHLVGLAAVGRVLGVREVLVVVLHGVTFTVPRGLVLVVHVLLCVAAPQQVVGQRVEQVVAVGVVAEGGMSDDAPAERTRREDVTPLGDSFT
eukprot:PhM_4_TR1195/c0_g1_i1/m.17344